MRPPVLLLAAFFALSVHAEDTGFAPLFNGHDLAGWKVTTENPGTFRVEDGMIVANGERAHLFFEGNDALKPPFKNFIFRARVKTMPHSNSGIYFHTKYQPEGWPEAGYEAQVNATHPDRRKTGGLYAVADVVDFAPNTDGEWFTYEIKVVDKTITLTITPDGGKPSSVEFIEPPDWKGPNPGMSGRKLSSGTIALQGHDPGSIVYFKDLELKVLPDSQ